MIISIPNSNESGTGKYRPDFLFFFKLLCFLSIVLNQNIVWGQEQIPSATDTDSILDKYVIDRKKQLNIKLEAGNDINTFQLIEEDKPFDLRPNLNMRYAVVLSYKFLSVRFGVRPKISYEEEQKKGSSDTFRFKLQLLFDNWNHVIEYNIDKGYYVSNTDDFLPSYNNIRLQFPEMKSRILSGASSYKFNQNYSIRAIESQTEIQAKSAGSLMPGLNYKFYSLTGSDVVKNEDGELITRHEYNEYSGLNLGIQIGYYYTFVFKRHWFANAFIAPVVGIDFYTTKFTKIDGTSKRSLNDSFLSLDYGMGAGYNSEKIFFGAKLKNHLTNEKFSSSKVSIKPSLNTFSIYFGYRFKAPKPISQPVDLLEEKIPLLKDEPK